MLIDLNALPPYVRDILTAAQKVDRENLDDVEVHVCDQGDDRVRRQGLSGARAALSEALANAGLTESTITERKPVEYLAFINTTKRALAATPHGLPISDKQGTIVALVVPDADGYTHHHAEEVRTAVGAALGETYK